MTRNIKGYITKVFEEIETLGLQPQNCIVTQMNNENTGTIQVLVEDIKTGRMYSFFIKEEDK